MMKLTNRQIVSSVPALDVLLNLKLPIKVSFKVAKTVRILNTSLEDYNKTFKKLQEEYAQKDDDGKVKVEDNKMTVEDVPGFEKAFEELLNIENSVEIEQFGLEDFGELEVEPSVFYKVDWLIKE